MTGPLPQHDADAPADGCDRRDWLARAGTAAAASGLGLGTAGWLAGCAAASAPAEAGSVADAGAASTPAPASTPASTPAAAPPADPPPAPDEPPPAPRELRGAWVATVANIDWPSRRGLSAAAMRAEAVALLDKLQALNLNLVVLQVRPAADALFPGGREPWTEFLSGAQGRPPWHDGEAGWDPLAFWLREARARGLELHAWINPYRARHATAQSPPAPSHVMRSAPGLVRRYGAQWWLDPGEPGAAEHTLAVARELLERYDLDGLHIDDYFYPYPEAVAGPGSADREFPDDASWARARAARGGGDMPSRADWRRANVDTLVERLHATVHAARPGARFGISPFGLPRPDRRPAGITGFSQYDRLFADVERWVEAGWFDYLVPQLYWPRDRAGQAFGTLLAHWTAEVATRGPAPTRHHWPGLFTSRVRRDPAAAYGTNVWPGAEIVEQVRLMRTRGTAGHIHFSAIALAEDRDGVATRLAAELYREPALVPATPWLDARVPAAPRLAPDGDGVLIGIDEQAAPVARWALWRRHADGWRFEVLPGARRRIALGAGTGAAKAEALVLSAVSRTGVEGPRVRLATA